MSPEDRKRELVALVAAATEARLASRERRHSSCVAPGLAPVTLARKLRADRLPPDAALGDFASRLVDWVLGEEGASKPYVEDDLEKSG